MELADSSFLMKTLEHWDNTPWGMVVVPFGFFLSTSLLIYFVCRFFEGLAMRMSSGYRGIAVATFAWGRRIGILLVLFLCLGLAFENISLFLLEKNARKASGILQSSGIQLQKASVVVQGFAASAARLALVAVAAVWVCRFLEEAVRVFFTRENILKLQENTESRSRLRFDTLRTTSMYVVRAGIAVVSVLVGMQTLGLSIAPLLATAGVASVAIGLGAQTLIRDVVAGFFVILEDQYAVGDVIDLGTQSGMVESMTLRVTKLRGADGAAIYVPNGEIKMVRNTTSEWARVDFRVRVKLEEDFARVESLLQDILASIATDLPNDVTGKPEYLGVDTLEEKYAVLRAWVRTKPLSRYKVERELNARVLRAFGAHHVQFPTS